MPFTLASATAMLDDLVDGDVYAHLHAAYPATSGNVITGAGYAGVQVTGGWTQTTVGAVRRLTNAAAVQFPTPGGDWTRAGAVGLWDRIDIAVNVGNPPGLLRSLSIPPIDARLNGVVVLAPGAIQIEIEVS